MRVNDKPSAPKLPVERMAKEGSRTGAVFNVASDQASVIRNAKIASVLSSVPLDAVLALQGETDQPVARRRRLARRGLAMVDKLDQIKISLLSGHSDSRHLDDLAILINEKREDDVPEDLTELLDSVDVRVAVELAKRGR
ncbi:MAG: flagellar assembly protein FliX [Hyphomicrobiales bacterium]